MNHLDESSFCTTDEDFLLEEDSYSEGKGSKSSDYTEESSDIDQPSIPTPVYSNGRHFQSNDDSISSAISSLILSKGNSNHHYPPYEYRPLSTDSKAQLNNHSSSYLYNGHSSYSSCLSITSYISLLLSFTTLLLICTIQILRHLDHIPPILSDLATQLPTPQFLFAPAIHSQSSTADYLSFPITSSSGRNKVSRDTYRPVRTLIIQSDSRQPEALNDNILALSVYINFQYTLHHKDVDYLLLNYNFNDSLVPDGEKRNDPKNAAYCYNSHLHQYRAASWCKLQSLYYIMEKEPNYDWYMFIDSDAAISNYYMPIDGFISFMTVRPDLCNNTQFLTPNNTCSLLFMSNEPWNYQLPNAGVFFIKRSEYSKLFFQKWWHVDLPDYNFLHTYEQMALFAIFNKDCLNQIPLTNIVGILNETSMAHASNAQFIQHRTSFTIDLRLPMLNAIIEQMNRDWRSDLLETQLTFNETIDYVNANRRIEFDTNTDIIPPLEPEQEKCPYEKEEREGA